jgi:hypothetical protein
MVWRDFFLIGPVDVLLRAPPSVFQLLRSNFCELQSRYFFVCASEDDTHEDIVIGRVEEMHQFACLRANLRLTASQAAPHSAAWNRSAQETP